MAFSVKYIVELVDRFSTNQRQVSRAFEEIDKRARGSADAAKAFEARMAGLRVRSAELQGQMLGVAASLYVFSKPLQSAIQFETAMADVRKAVTFDKPGQFEAIGEDIKAMSLRIPIAADGIASIVSAGGRLGVARENLANFALVAAKASTAWDINPQEAGDQLANLSVRLGVPIAKIEELSDAINYLDDNTNAKAKDILEVMGRVSGTFKILKFPPELAAGFATFANQMMVSPELAASGLQMMLGKMQLMGPAMNKALMTDPKKAIFGFLDSIKKMPESARIEFLKKTFGDEASRFVNQMIGSQDILAQTLGLVGNKMQFVGSMTREFEVRSKTTANQIQLMQNQLNVMGINLGTVLLPAINGILKALSPLMEFLGRLASEFPVVTGVIVGGTIALAAWRVAAVAATFASVQMQLAFLSLPAAIQKAIVAFRVLSVAMLTTPIGLIITGVGVMIGLGVHLYNNFKPFADLIDRIWGGIKSAFEWLAKLVGLSDDAAAKTASKPNAYSNPALERYNREHGIVAPGRAGPAEVPAMGFQIPSALKPQNNVSLEGIIAIKDPGGMVKSASARSAGPIGPLGLSMELSH